MLASNVLTHLGCCRRWCCLFSTCEISEIARLQDDCKLTCEGEVLVCPQAAARCRRERPRWLGSAAAPRGAGTCEWSQFGTWWAEQSAPNQNCLWHLGTHVGWWSLAKQELPHQKKHQKENRPKEPPHQKKHTHKKNTKNYPTPKKNHTKKNHTKRKTKKTKRKTIPKRGMALIMWWYMNSLARQQTAFNLEFKLVHSALPNHQLNKQLTCDYVMLKWTWNIYDKCDLADSNISFWEQIRESSFDIRAPKLMQTIKQSIWILQMQQC